MTVEITMDIEQFLDQIKKSDPSNKLLTSTARTLMIKGASGSLFSVLIVLDSTNEVSASGVTLCVMEDRDAASYLYNDLYNLLETNGSQDRVMLLPTAYKRAISSEREDPSGIVQRTAALTAIAAESNAKRKEHKSRLIICTWAEALAEKVVSRERLDGATLTIARGDRLGMDFVESTLEEYKFERVEFVSRPGQYAMRGGIFDIFSYANNKPYRLDFLGDQIDSIRTFAPSSQLTDASCEVVEIVPNLKNETLAERRVTLAEYIGEEGVKAWFSNIEQSLTAVDALGAAIRGKGVENEKEVITSRSELLEQTERWDFRVQNIAVKERGVDSEIDFGSAPQPTFNKNFELLAANIEQNYDNGIQTYLLTASIDQFERLENILQQITDRDRTKSSSTKLRNTQLTLHRGFVLPSINAAYYTDHQIFERYLRYKVRGEIDKAEGMTLAEFTALKVGDYVVHIDHGVGRFGGLVKQREADSVKEFIKLTYRDGDVLFVGVHNLHRISKFKDGDISVPPVLQKLGSSQWAKLKESTKRKVKEIARELTTLYAKRKSSEGFAFSPDSYMQKELEASFIYEDTPDQRSTTEAIKADMESKQPMDRLVCGDVGFGKTELAVRAACKAAADGKQVAVLVPTTLLSLQHFRTFTRRLKNFPVRVENFSRAKSAKQVNEILQQIENGTVDIVIGTHKLLGKNVKFKDLGLLIIDEEQKFGVSMKERLREMKVSIDTLTLTATPIPRTLQFSLLGARDMSIINTPPPNRRSVATEVHVWDEDVVRTAIEYELSRSGQVFVLHNRVQTIDRFAAQIERLVPGARVAVGHGQMNPKQLEETIMDFIFGEFNVLVASSIIENGIDIPNANTIIINNAHLFGLSDLHQLRGRVGRTNRKAFCYLMIPSAEAMTSDAQRRLRAIEEFSDLGSGFNIAMQDLDIRGAGNILGAEQSGFMADIGYETFQKIIDEAIGELREEQGLASSQDQLLEVRPTDCIVEIDTAAHLPDSYIGSTSEKIRLYRQLDSTTTAEELDEFINRLIDRFGEPPTEARELFEVVLLRALGSRLGLERIVVKNGGATLFFAAPAQSPFYAGEVFRRIVGHVLANPTKFKLREGAKLSIQVRATASIAALRECLDVSAVHI